MADAPWFAVHIDYWRNPKVAEAGMLAAGLNLAAIAYCAEQLTDGFIPTRVVQMLAAPFHGWVWVGEDGLNITPRDVMDSRWGPLAQDLVAARLWEEVDGGYRIVNYLDHQPSRVEVEKRREQARVAGAMGGRKRAANRVAKRTASESLGEPLSGRSSEPSSGFVPPTPTPTEQPTTSVVGRSRAKRATAAPDAFPITDEMREWGRRHAPSVTDPAAETEHFLDHHRAKGTTFKDWSAAWRTWMTNAQKYAQQRSPNLRAVPPRVAHNQTALQEAFDRALEAETGQPAIEGWTA